MLLFVEETFVMYITLGVREDCDSSFCPLNSIKLMRVERRSPLVERELSS